MPSRARYSQETLETILGRLQAAPAEPVPTSYSAAGLVRALAPKIHEMTKKGYSWEAIARVMTDGGVTLSANLLRKYVAESLDKAKGKKRTLNGTNAENSRPRPAQVLTSGPPQSPPATSADSIRGRNEPHASAPPAHSPSVSPGNPGPRSDTPDI